MKPVTFLFALDPLMDLKRSARRRLYQEATEAVNIHIPGVKVELLDDMELEVTIDLDDPAFGSGFDG